MAAEIKVTMALAVRKGGTLDGIDLGTFSVTMTGNNVLHNRQNVGTVEEALLLGDVPAGGWFIAVNRDATNSISVRPSAGAIALVSLPPGEPACFRIGASAAPQVIAAPGAAELEYVVVEA